MALDRIGSQIVAEGLGEYLSGIARAKSGQDSFSAATDRSSTSVAAYGASLDRIRLDKLTGQLGLQREQLTALQGKYQSTVQSSGIFSAAAERQRAAIDRLSLSIQNTEQRAGALTQKIAAEATAVDRAGQEAQQAVAPTTQLEQAIERAGRSAQDAGPRFSAMGEIVTGSLRYIGELGVRAGMAIGREFADGIRGAISAGMTFEHTMSGVQAVIQPTAEQFAALSEKALQLGADTSFSAQQAGEAIEMLGQNGLNYEQIIGGAADATIALAAATGDKGLVTSAAVATDVMANFTDVAGNMTAAIDGISGTTVASKFNIDDYRLALAQAGGVAGGLGVEFEDFNTTLAVTSSAFASGSDAGTSFKTFLQTLTPDTKPAIATFKELNLITADGQNQFYTASGALKSMSEIAGILQGALSGLSEQQRSQALETIFGTDAMRTADQVARAGAEGFNEAATAIGKISAAEQAAQRLDNLSGDVEQLKGSLETLSIVLFQAFGDGLRPIVQFGTQAANVLIAFARGSDDAQSQLYTFIGAIDNVIPGFASFYQSAKSAISGLADFATDAYTYGAGIAEQFAAGIMTAVEYVTSALSYIGDIITYWLQPNSPPNIVPDLDQYGADAAQLYLDSWRPSDYSMFQEIGRTIESELRSIWDAAGDALPKDGLIPMIVGTRDAVADAISALEETGEIGEEAYQRIRDAAGPAGEAIADNLKLMVEAAEKADALSRAQDDLNRITAEYDDILSDLKGQQEAVNDAYENSATQDALDANKAAQKALDDLEKEAKLNEIINSDDATAAEKEEARLKKEQLALERVRDAEKKARDEALNGLDEQIDQQSQLRDDAVTAAEERVKQAAEEKKQADEALKVYQDRLAIDKESRDLSREHLDIMKQIAKEAEKAAKAAAKAGGAGPKKPGGGKAPALPTGGLGDIAKPAMPGTDALGRVAETAAAVATDVQAAKQSIAGAIDQIVIEKDRAVSAFSELGIGIGPLLAGIGAVVASVVVPAMFSAASAFVVAAAPLAAIAAAGALLYTAWSTNFLGIQDVVATVWSGISGIFASFTSTFSTARESGATFWESFKLAANAAWETFSTALPGVLEVVGTFFQGLIDYAMLKLPEWGAALVEFGVASLSWITDRLPGLIDTLGQYFNTMINWVVDSLPAWGAHLATFGGKAINWVLDALPGLGTNLGMMAGTIFGWIIDTTADVVPKLFTMAGKFLSWVWTDVLPELPSVLDRIGEGIYNFIQTLAEQAGPKLKIVGDAFLNWVTADVIPYIGGKLDEFQTTVFTWVLTHAVDFANQFMQLGKDIVGGITSGITSEAGQLFDSLRNLASDALQAVKDAISSNSPSKLFMVEVGKPIAQGIALGITDNQALVSGALANMPAFTAPDLRQTVTMQDRTISPAMPGRTMAGSTYAPTTTNVINVNGSNLGAAQLQGAIVGALNTVARNAGNRGRMRG